MRVIQFPIGDKPNTVSCDYMETCDFKCKPFKDIKEENIKLDTYNEAFIFMNTDKIIQRIQVIQPILDYFPKFKKVNSLYIEDFNTLLNKIHQFIFTYYELLEEFTYSVIHGDPNFSNILINPDNHETCFIDPRGYFSSSEIYGSIDYDYAKILYGLSGYDEFNNHHFVIDYLDEKEIKFKIEEIDVSNAFKEERFTTIHKMMVVIIWLGLAEYNKNNIWKCVASYYHGLYLGSQIHL